MGGCALGLNGESIGLCLDRLLMETGVNATSTVSLYGMDVGILWNSESEGLDLVSALGCLGQTQERILVEARAHIPACRECRGEYAGLVYKMAGASLAVVRNALKAKGMKVGVPEMYDLYSVAMAVDSKLLGIV
ncbi:hypothetical protein HYV82_02385 [Candidatus Woesearchaeota archaeon]|nr:hypothetical protein [Candidatus Woesearchaeota archaeon]